MFFKQFEFSDHTGPVYCASKSGNYLFSSGADKLVVRWDLKTLKQDNFVIRLEHSAYCIIHLSNNPYLVIGCSNGDLHVIHTELKKEIKFIQHHKSAIFSIHEIPEKNLLLTGDSEGNLCAWNNIDFQLRIQIPLNSGKIRSIFNYENEILIGSKDGKLRFFDLDFFNQIDELYINKEGINSILKLKNLFLIGGYDGYLYLVDSKTKKVISKMPAHKGPIYSLIKLNEVVFISASRDKTIKIWDIKTLKVIEKKEFKSGGHRNSVNHLSPFKENCFISCSDDSKIILWSS